MPGARPGRRRSASVAGVPEVRLRRCRPALRPGLPRALDGVSLRLPAGWPAGGHRVERRRQVEPRHRALALLAARGGHALARRDGRGAAAPRPTSAARCALADQRAQLFAGTVRSNLTLGRPDATDEEIDAALARRPPRPTGWRRLPEGLDTPVGEDGVALSGGERRRLAVARALLAPGPLSWSSTSRPAGSTPPWPTSWSTACSPPPVSGASC